MVQLKQGRYLPLLRINEIYYIQICDIFWTESRNHKLPLSGVLTCVICDILVVLDGHSESFEKVPASVTISLKKPSEINNTIW